MARRTTQFVTTSRIMQPSRQTERNECDCDNDKTMAKLDDVVQRQAEGARFVISAQLLGMTVEAFDVLAQTWSAGGPGFALAAVPHRKCIDGEFFIDRVTVVRLSV